ncbi:hypothetical protein [Pontibacter indicus]|uniref:hypothetical protein n=1 Tax=Pontibacter indicus TaxID=1317125 RepID=UPI00097604D6|nr:hypothetical protein [Pontibacter indicus]
MTQDREVVLPPQFRSLDGEGLELPTVLAIRQRSCLLSDVAVHMQPVGVEYLAGEEKCNFKPMGADASA